MEPLRVLAGTLAPGADESWAELAEHSLTGDDVDHPRTPCPPPPGSPQVI
jgi:hypothetical protein